MQQILRTPAPRPIFDGLRGIAPESDPESLPPGAPVRKALDIDSYDFLMFLIDLNGTPGIDLPE